MSHSIQVTVHPSQFPGAVRSELWNCLRQRRLSLKFHYDGIRQTRKWLALHRAYSPWQRDPDCAGTYQRAFREAAGRIPAGRLHVLGLGCGGGQKDLRLLEELSATHPGTGYVPCDVSTPMVLVAAETVAARFPGLQCQPLVCDLLAASDLPAVADTLQSGPRLVTFFGMIPGFEPQEIMPRLRALVRPGDWLLFSANLLPGPDYEHGLAQVLPQYDNPLTREWLLGFLVDLGAEPRGLNRPADRPTNGELLFSCETGGASAARRITAAYHFDRESVLYTEDEAFPFSAGESLRVFFSGRYTPESVRTLLTGAGLQVEAECLTASGEEGVWLARG